MNRYRMRFAPQVWTPSLSPTLVKWLRPFRERMAESLDKFEEDVLRKPTALIKVRRQATVQFGEPVEALGDRKVKNQTTTITTTIEQRVQSMLDEVA
jgi:hypothetical protein